MATYKTLAGDMVDGICARHYRQVPIDQAITVVLDANIGLAAHGPVLPEGLLISLPEIKEIEVKPTIQLWD